MLATIFAALILGNANYRAQCPLPTAVIPQGLGIDIHFVIPPNGEIEKIASAGYKWVRMDMYWAVVEKHSPNFNFKPYDELMDELDKNHIRPIFILDSINQAYGQVPNDPNVVAGFCRFVGATVQHFQHRGIVWEFWNEPNLDDYWKPHANYEEYMALATQVGQTIRAVAPDEWYIAPALSHWDWPYLEGCFQKGLLDVVDGVSVHPYRDEEPETVAADWQKLRGMIKQYAPAGKSIAMISGEWGYSDYLTGLEKQAQYAARMYLINMASGANLTIWYDWSDDTDAGEPRQRHFGAVYPDLRAKPVVSYIKALENELSGFKFLHRMPSDPDQYLFVFEKDGARKVVAWTTREAGSAVVLGDKVKNVVALNGARSTIAADHTVALDGTPKVIY
ncbi:MAG TPA: cellulase family glycosylhydrolase [Fimbriimonadaceae bacterium]